MDFMDADFIDDPIHELLLAKLQIAKDCTDRLRETIEQRKKIQEDLQKGLEKNDGVLKIGKVAKKLLHGNYIVKVDLSTTSNAILSNLQCILHWNSSVEIHYNTKFFSKDLENIKHIAPSSSAVLIVVIRQVKFIEKTSYNMNAVITYNNEEESIDGQTAIPPFTLEVADFTNNFDVKSSEIVRGLPLGILAILSSYTLTTYATYTTVSETPSMRQFRSCLSIDCMLREVIVAAPSVQYKLYYVDGASEAINGALLRLRVPPSAPGEESKEGIMYLIDMYTRSEDQLHNLLHYMHKNIVDLEISPVNVNGYSGLNLRENINPDDRDQQKKLLAAKLLNEIKLGKKLTQLAQVTVSSDQTKQLILSVRRDLSKAEEETDNIARKVLQ